MSPREKQLSGKKADIRAKKATVFYPRSKKLDITEERGVWMGDSYRRKKTGKNSCDKVSFLLCTQTPTVDRSR
ncbi:hypothetical protein VULLAG_LOCUS14134 [Vulpes lagopus]